MSIAHASFILAVMLTGATPGLAASYGDTLLASEEARHPDLLSVKLDVAGKNGPLAVRRGQTDAGWGANTLALTDAMGNAIGTVTLRLRPGSTDTAGAIAADLARRIYTPDGLAEPDPFVAAGVRAPRAQALVDRMVDTHPGLVTLAMHVTVPGDSVNRIIASNFGRIGKAADDDDRHVFTDGATLREVTNAGRRVAVELPMHDRNGAVIGALSTSFLLAPGEDAAAAEVKAVKLRDDIARATLSLSALTKD